MVPTLPLLSVYIVRMRERELKAKKSATIRKFIIFSMSSFQTNLSVSLNMSIIMKI